MINDFCRLELLFFFIQLTQLNYDFIIFFSKHYHEIMFLLCYLKVKKNTHQNEDFVVYFVNEVMFVLCKVFASYFIQ